MVPAFSRLNRLSLARPFALVLIWTLVILAVLPVHAQPTNTAPLPAGSPNLDGVWLIVDGKECTPLGSRQEMTGRVRTAQSGQSLGLEFCGSYLVPYGRYAGSNFEARGAEDGAVLVRGTVAADGNVIQGEEIDARTGAVSRFVWQREVTGVSAEPVAEVRIVASEAPFTPLEAIPSGGTFMVEVLYRKDPQRAEVSVSITSSSGGSVEALARRTADPRLYRTPPVQLTEAGASPTKVEP